MNKKAITILGVVSLAIIAGVFLYFNTNKQKAIDNEGQKNVEITKEQKLEIKGKRGLGEVVYFDEDISTKQEVVNNQSEEEIAKQEQYIKDLISSLPETSLEELGFQKMDMSSWKTYRNEDLGFEVKYPQNWTYGEGSMAGESEVIDVTFSAPGDVPGGGTWRVIPLEKGRNAIEEMVKFFKNEKGIIKKLKINERDAIYGRVVGEKQVMAEENGVYEYFLILSDSKNGKNFKLVNDYYSKRNYINIKFLK